MITFAIADSKVHSSADSCNALNSTDALANKIDPLYLICDLIKTNREYSITPPPKAYVALQSS